MITKFTLTFLLSFSFIFSGYSQKLNWTSTSAGSQQFGVQVSEHVWDIEATNTNVVVAGYITGPNAKFGDIVMPVENTANQSEFYNYLANYDVNGKALWVKRISMVYKTDIAIDADKNVWVAFTDDISQNFIRKYSPNGELLLEKKIQLSSKAELTTISIDKSQAVILTGVMEVAGSKVTIEGKEFTGLKESSGAIPKTSFEAIIIKYNKDLAFQWANISKGTDRCIPNVAQIDSNNNLILVGEFSTESNKQLQLSPDIKLSAFPKYSTTYTSGFIAKISPDGQFIWADNIRSQSNSWANGVTINAQDQIQVIGSFTGTATLKNSQLVSKGSNDILFTKLDTDGNVIWLKSAGGNYPDQGLGDVGRSIANDKHGNIFLSGSFINSSTFGEGVSAITLKTEYTYDRGGYVAQYNTDGDIVWVEKINRPTSSKAEVQKVAVNATTLYASGNFFKNVSLFNTSLPIAYADMDHVFLTSIDFSSMVTALPELRDTEQHISVYPNPATTSFKLNIKKPVGKITAFKVINSTGQVMFTLSDFNPDHTVDTSAIPAGLYSLILQTDKYIIKKKLIII